jgi:hypothetical protein
MKPHSYALVSNPPIRWLIGREPDLKAYIQAFARDEAPRDFLDVAGPPDIDELARCRANPKRKPLLPLIRLTMRKVRHHLTGEHGIEVKCSDDDCDKIVSWHEQARHRAALQAAPQQERHH